MTTANEQSFELRPPGKPERPIPRLWPTRGSVLDLDEPGDVGPGSEPRRRAPSSSSPLSEIVGQSESLQLALRRVRAVAVTDATVLIHGETGTGKELIARAVHQLSGRSPGSFIAVNCAAMPASLLESELFGHERGAFTGATSRRPGRFELAHDGTLFLDEIGELPTHLQPKLLRVLQERQFERLGGTRSLRTNARVIAATNRDLRSMMRDGAFREDLYYRLSVVPLRIPPLRERKEDIPLLARHFVEVIATRLGKPIAPPSVNVLNRLLGYEWPGNIRELQNVLERAVIFADGPRIDLAEDLMAEASLSRTQLEPAAVVGELAVSGPTREPQSFAAVSKAHILRVLEETHWVIAGPRGAAAKLELNRTTLTARMKKLGISRSARF